MVLRYRPTPTWCPINVSYIPLDNTQLNTKSVTSMAQNVKWMGSTLLHLSKNQWGIQKFPENRGQIECFKTKLDALKIAMQNILESSSICKHAQHGGCISGALNETGWCFTSRLIGKHTAMRKASLRLTVKIVSSKKTCLYLAWEEVKFNAKSEHCTGRLDRLEDGKTGCHIFFKLEVVYA